MQSEKKSDYVLKCCRNVQYLISWELFPFYWKEYYRRRKATLSNKTPLNVKLRQIIDWWVVTRKRPVNAVIKSPGKLFRLSIKIGRYFDVLSNIVITICTFNLIDRFVILFYYIFIASFIGCGFTHILVTIPNCSADCVCTTLYVLNFINENHGDQGEWRLRVFFTVSI